MSVSAFVLALIAGGFCGLYIEPFWFGLLCSASLGVLIGYLDRKINDTSVDK